MRKFYNQYVQLMQLRNFSPRTIEAYTYHMKCFVQFFGKSPEQLNSPEISRFLHYLRFEKKRSWSGIMQAYGGLKFFYVNVLHRDWQAFKIPYPKKEKRLPVVLSPTEVQMLLQNIENYKNKVALMTMYSAGLRLRETLQLKIHHIDSERMQIKVEQGKGKKDRYTILSQIVLTELRRYYIRNTPTNWLFPGTKNPDKHMGTEVLQRAFKEAKKKPT